MDEYKDQIDREIENILIAIINGDSDDWKLVLDRVATDEIWPHFRKSVLKIFIEIVKQIPPEDDDAILEKLYSLPSDMPMDGLLVLALIDAVRTGTPYAKEIHPLVQVGLALQVIAIVRETENDA